MVDLFANTQLSTNGCNTFEECITFMTLNNDCVIKCYFWYDSLHTKESICRLFEVCVMTFCLFKQFAIKVILIYFCHFELGAIITMDVKIVDPRQLGSYPHPWQQESADTLIIPFAISQAHTEAAFMSHTLHNCIPLSYTTTKALEMRVGWKPTKVFIIKQNDEAHWCTFQYKYFKYFIFFMENPFVNNYPISPSNASEYTYGKKSNSVANL